MDSCVAPAHMRWCWFVTCYGKVAGLRAAGRSCSDCPSGVAQRLLFMVTQWRSRIGQRDVEIDKWAYWSTKICWLYDLPSLSYPDSHTRAFENIARSTPDKTVRDDEVMLVGLTGRVRTT